MKTMYIRETDSKSGKQRWIRVSGVKSDGVKLRISRGLWSKSSDPVWTDSRQVLYTKR